MITIVCVAHNEEKMLRRTVPSWAPFCDEIFLVLDQTDDESTLPVYGAEGVASQVLFVNGEYPLNELLQGGAERAKGNWIIRLDADEELKGDPEAFLKELERLEKLYRESEEAGHICLNFRLEGEEWEVAPHMVRGWYIGEKNWEDVWRFHYAVNPVVLPVDAQEDQVMGGVLYNMAHICCLRRSDRSAAKERKKEAMEKFVNLEACSPEEKCHYERELKQLGGATLSLCVMFKQIDESLLRMLGSITGQVDEYVLMATHPVDWEELPPLDAPVVTLDYRDPDQITLPGGGTVISDFARARSACFEAASGRWRMFLDSDDELHWIGEGEPMPLKEIVNIQERKGVTSISLPYEYLRIGGETQLSHDKERLVKWFDDEGNRLFEWDGPLHEDLINAPSNPGRGLLVAKAPGDIYEVLHHDSDSSLERNRAICTMWEDSPEISPKANIRLKYTLGMILLEEDPPRGERRLLDLISAHGRTSYGLVAAIDLSMYWLAMGRSSEVPGILLPMIDAWPYETTLYILMARTHRESGRLDEVRFYLNKAYFEVLPLGEISVRKFDVDVELSGRLEAALAFLDARDFTRAKKVISEVPERFKTHESIIALERMTAMEEGDSHAALHVKAITNYLLSIDQADQAEKVLDCLPPFLFGEPMFKEARRGVRTRLSHLNNEEEYVEAYDKLNEADLVVGPRQHLTTLLKKVLEKNPKTFIDVGCNTGWLCLQVAKAFPECEVRGYDIGPARVTEATRRARHMGLTNCEFFEGEVHYGTYAHPLVLSASEVLEHMEIPAEVLIAAEDIGVDHILLTVPDLENYHRLMLGARRMDWPLEENVKSAKQGREHVRCFDAHTLVDLVEEYFLVERVERIDVTAERGDQTLLFLEGRRFSSEPPIYPRNLGRIDIWAKGYVPWGPRAHETAHVGGSEQAVIHIAPFLARQGYEVHVYASPIERLGFERGVFWHHESHFDVQANRDLLLVWRRPEILLEAKKASRGRWPVAIWCHDVPDPEKRDLYHLADEVLCLSEYQKELYLNMTRCTEDQISVLQNGLLRESIKAARKPVEERNPHHVFYGSSADRGLLHLLRMWPKVLEAIPDAQLHACYSLDLLYLPGLDPVWRRIADEVKRLSASLQGFHFHGGRKHKDYLELASTCGIWAYPTGFDEISCIVAMETQALGLVSVSSDRAALKNTILEGELLADLVVMGEAVKKGAKMEGGTWWFPEEAYSATFLEVLLDTMQNPPDTTDLATMALETYDWERTAELFSRRFEELINGSQHQDP